MTAANRIADRAAVGAHLIADLFGVAPERLSNKEALTRILRTALEANGFHILSESGHSFPGEHAGVTVLFLLSESHAAIHTYPEREYAALDIFSCGSRADPEAALEAIANALSPDEVRTFCRERGKTGGG